jgi:multidrug resistance protein MdtO
MPPRNLSLAKTRKQDLSKAYAQLEQAAWKGLPKNQNQFSPQIESLLLRSRGIAFLTDSSEEEV